MIEEIPPLHFDKSYIMYLKHMSKGRMSKEKKRKKTYNLFGEKKGH